MLKLIREHSDKNSIVTIWHDKTIDYYDVQISVPYRQRYTVDNLNEANQTFEQLVQEQAQ